MDAWMSFSEFSSAPNALTWASATTCMSTEASGSVHSPDQSPVPLLCHTGTTCSSSGKHIRRAGTSWLSRFPPRIPLFQDPFAWSPGWPAGCWFSNNPHPWRPRRDQGERQPLPTGRFNKHGNLRTRLVLMGCKVSRSPLLPAKS